MAQDKILTFLYENKRKYFTAAEIHEALFPKNHIRGTKHKIKQLVLHGYINIDHNLILKMLSSKERLIYKYRISEQGLKFKKNKENFKKKEKRYTA